MILGVVQARVTSTRLPGKVLLPLLGEPMILRQLERVSRSRMLDRVVVATSTDSSDDPLAEVCRAAGYEVCRGPLDDVLDRFVICAERYKPDHVVRLTGDCPLSDPQLVDRVVREHLDGGFDYTSNTLAPTYPDGLDVEVIRMSALRKIAARATSRAEREHVTLGVYRRPDEFSLGSVEGGSDLSRLRWTVDEPEDLEFVRAVYGALYEEHPEFSMADVIALLEASAALSSINDGFMRNEGLARSLREEASGVSEEKA